MHLGALCSLIWGNFYSVIAFIIGYVMISGLGVAVGYHRFYSHKAFKTNTFFKVLMTWMGGLSGQGKPIFWVSVHRTKHHAFSDQPGDAHSPRDGIWHAYMGWMFKIKPGSTRMTGVNDLMRDKIAVWFHKHYYLVLWGTWLLLASISLPILLGVMVAQVWAFHQENLVDVFCHVRGPWGYRNHDTSDDSLNVPILGLLAWGQGWHNNHHYIASTYDYGERWWEFDPAKILVRMISK